MSRIVVLVPQTRKLCGRLAMLSGKGEPLLGPLRVLARASRRIGRLHGNPTCARSLTFGDPPAGSYAVAGSFPPDTLHPRRPRRFGRLGALLLEPRTGEAREAFANGRRLIMLHGGPRDRAGRLRPTRGGLRLADGDLAALFRALNAAHEQGDPVDGLDLVDVRDDAIFESIAPSPHRGRGSVEIGLLLGGLASSSVDGGKSMPRRRFILAALLLSGGLGMSACDRASRCEGPACDPDDGAGGRIPFGSGGSDDGGMGGGMGSDGGSLDDTGSDDDSYTSGGGSG